MTLNTVNEVIFTGGKILWKYMNSGKTFHVEVIFRILLFPYYSYMGLLLHGRNFREKAILQKTQKLPICENFLIYINMI